MGSITPPGSALMRRLRRGAPGRSRLVLAAVLFLAFLATFAVDWAVSPAAEAATSTTSSTSSVTAGSVTASSSSPASAPASAPASTGPCTVSPTNGCIRGTILDSERKPAKGIDVDVSGPGGFAQTASTDDTGRWSVSVTTAGQYTVSVDQGSLPKGQYLTNAADADRKVNATLNANVGQIFQLSDQQGATTDTDSSSLTFAGPGSSSPPASGSACSSPSRPSASR